MKRNCFAKNEISLKKSVLAAFTLLAFVSGGRAQPAPDAIDGTTGAPLGGIGAGAVKFCAHNGTFSYAFMTPCALPNFPPLPNTQFQFFSKRGQNAPVTSGKLTGVITNGRCDDDAVYPIHQVNFGTIDKITVTMTAFTPFDLSNIRSMCYPYSFFQFDITNTDATPAEVAIAFQSFTFGVPVLVTNKGYKNDTGTVKQAIYATSSDVSAVISAGNDNGFFTSGQCNNSPSGYTNKVAVKVALGANESKTIKFVFAWHAIAEGAEKLPRFYYSNFFNDAGSVADTGLIYFDRFRTNALSLVTRMRASNIPAWIKNQATVSLSNLTNNSLYTKDGRYAHTEGEWNTNGTMDQMWHSRSIYAQLVPSLVWQELHYWESTQKTNPAGQIHHDLGEHYNMAYMCPWNDRQHTDYRDIDLWVDLNCAYIISVYECFIATDNHVQLDSLWPSVQKAGQRILNMVTSLGNQTYPFTFTGSQNSYDSDNQNPDPYNASLTIPTYKILSILADIKQEPTVKHIYDSAYTKIIESFKKRYLTNNFPSGRISEAAMTGQWLSYFLKFGDVFDTASINYAVKELNSYYSPLTSGLGAAGYSEWAPYMINHYGGLLQYTGKLPEWKSIQYDWYERIFNNRNLVYNQELGIPSKVGTPTYLATSTEGKMQYISIPCVWRNYYSLVGFSRNKHTGELWLEPIIPPEMNHQMDNALVFSPEGWATISCTESGNHYTTKRIFFKPDSPMAVNAIYLTDNGSKDIFVRINTDSIAADKITRIGTGYQKEIKINWQNTITPDGAKITISDAPIGIIYSSQQMKGNYPVFFNTSNSFSIITRRSTPHHIALYSINGKLITNIRGSGEMKYSFTTRNQRGAMALKAGIYIIRVTSKGMVWNRQFIISR